MARLYCEHCGKPESVCLCAWVQPQDNKLAIVILQHPDESSKALATAALVQSGLTRAKLVSELTFEATMVMKLLSGLSAQNPLLLYPKPLADDTQHYVLNFETEHLTWPPLLNAYDSLILLDGTWRNTRELLLLNPWLKTLPTLELKHSEVSRYKIRQAKKPGALATIEAVSKVLAVADDNYNAEQFLLPFEKMIEYQIARMGQDVYRQNYLAKSLDSDR